MIAYKRFTADGVTNRFLSDIIIRSEQFTRVYSYVYDNTLNIDGSEDVLQNPLLPWAYPTNLYRRGANFPNSSFDLINLDKWDLADNSILFYTVPPSGSKVYIEVATTAEEFGSTLTAPAVNRAEAAAALALASKTAAGLSATAALASETAAGLSAAAAALSETNAAASETAAALSETNANASKVSAALSESNAAASETAAGLSETNAAASEAAAAISETNAGVSATNAQLREWEAEADALTADSYATEAEDTFVNLVTSDGDGTFTYTPTTDYSALHYKNKAQASAASIDLNLLSPRATTITPDADSDYTLTAAENGYGRLVLVDGSWTVAHNIIVDTSERSFLVDASGLTVNATVKTSAGTGIAVLAGSKVELLCDGTNIIESVSAVYTDGLLSTETFLHIQHQEPSGTSGGASVIGTQTRVLNTILTNTISGASLLSNQITLPQGVYFIRAESIAYQVGLSKGSIYNITDASTELVGMSVRSPGTDAVTATADVSGVITLAASKTLELRQYCTTATSNGLGAAVSSGLVEVYSDIKIWKVA